MKIWILPDIHGTWGQLMSVLEKARNHNVDRILQVGDCGWQWPGEPKDSLSHLLNRYKIPFLWLPGNHDNWTRLDDLKGDDDIKQISDYNFYLPRNTYFNLFGINFYAFGGAECTDFQDRTYGSLWNRNPTIWLRESPSQEEIDILLDKTSKLPIDVFLSHDAPISMRPPRKQLYNPISCRWTDYTSLQLEKARQNLNAKLWFYGHHHELLIQKDENTVFCCSGIIDEINQWSPVRRRQWAELSDNPSDMECRINQRTVIQINDKDYYLNIYSDIK